MTIWDLPLFILNELSSGPYGPEVTAKIARIQRWYEMYLEGADFDVEPDEDGYEPTVLKSKKIHRLIDKEAEFMVGKTPDVLVSVDGEDIDSDNTAAMQAYLDKVLAKNNFPAKIIRGVRDCLIGGRVFLKVNVDPNAGIKLMFVPADSFVYETAPDDVDTLTKVILFYCVVSTDDKGDQRWWRQIYRMDGATGRVFVKEDLWDGYGNKIPGYGTEETDTGLSRIPGCVIINDGLSGDFDGESDVEMIAAEDSEYNKSRSENQDSLSKNMNPMAYIIGANPRTFKGLDRRPGAVNDIQPDPVLGGTLPQVGQLENNFSFATAYQQTLSDIRAEMYDAIGMPDLTLAATSGLVTSGKGLKALYWPLICRCDGKWATWRPALEQMAELIIDAAQVYPDLKDKYGDFDSLPYTVTIEPQYALPDDENEERTLDMQEVQAGSRSIKSYLMKWGGNDAAGLTAEQADAEIEQIANEKRMMEAAFEDMSEIDAEEE